MNKTFKKAVVFTVTACATGAVMAADGDPTAIDVIKDNALVGIAALSGLVLAVGGAAVALTMGEKGVGVSKRNIKRV